MARKSRKNIAAAPSAGMKVWKAALYVRLSVELNGKRGDSLETQRQIMEAYIALCPDIEIVDVYTDNGITWQHFERQEFQRMLAGYIYHCISNQRIGKGACDNEIGYLQETDLFDTILSYVQSEAEIVIGKSLRLKQQDKKIAAQREQTEREIAALQREAEKARTYLAGLYENFITGVLTQTEYHDMKAEYHQKVMDCVQRVHALQERQGNLEKQAARCLSLADRLAAVKKSADLTAAFVSQVIERVTVNAADDISVTFAFEDDFDGLMEALEDV